MYARVAGRYTVELLLMDCFECGEPATEQHHVVPRVLGGTKTVPLCGRCHAIVHGLNAEKRTQHSILTREGIARARERGVVLGSPRKITNAVRKRVLELRAEGLTQLAICDRLTAEGFKPNGTHWRSGTIHRIIQQGADY